MEELLIKIMRTIGRDLFNITNAENADDKLGLLLLCGFFGLVLLLLIIKRLRNK